MSWADNVFGMCKTYVAHEEHVTHSEVRGALHSQNLQDRLSSGRRTRAPHGKHVWHNEGQWCCHFTRATRNSTKTRRCTLSVAYILQCGYDDDEDSSQMHKHKVGPNECRTRTWSSAVQPRRPTRAPRTVLKKVLTFPVLMNTFPVLLNTFPLETPV
jgi:hypothetical protein